METAGSRFAVDEPWVLRLPLGPVDGNYSLSGAVRGRAKLKLCAVLALWSEAVRWMGTAGPTVFAVDDSGEKRLTLTANPSMAILPTKSSFFLVNPRVPEFARGLSLVVSCVQGTHSQQQ